MKLKTHGLLLAAALFTASAGTASASTTYDFTGGANPAGPFTLGCDVGGGLNVGCSVTLNAAGLGVSSPADTQPGQIDSAPVNAFETIIISFSQAVVLQSFALGLLNVGDAYEYSLDGGSFSATMQTNPNVVGQIVTSFAVRASSNNIPSVDDFTLSDFSIAPVPLPAAGLMLATAIGGLAFFRRKNKAA